jgi:drug/metabolite transporter (DMT)-like permease
MQETQARSLQNPGLGLYLKVLFCVAVWGGSFIATKFTLREVSPVTVVWLRFAIGLIVLAVVVLLRRQFSLPKRSDLVYYGLLGLQGITFHQWLQSTGLQTSGASTTAWIVATIPVFTAVLGWLVLKEKFAWLKGLGIGLAAVGVLLVVSNGDLRSVFGSGFGTPGDLLILISAPNWAVFSILSRRGLHTIQPALMLLYVLGFGWLFSTRLLAAGPGLSEIGALTLYGWLGIAFLGIFCSGLAYIFWYDALAVLPASEVGAFVYLEPLVTVVVAAIILAEPILWSSIAGGVVILGGVWLVQK